jgi:hypothetical protein
VKAWQNLSGPRCRGRFFPALGVFLTFLIAPSAMQADALEDAARALARKIVAVLPQGRPVSLAWQNRSSILEPQSDLLRRAFATELENNKIGVSQEASAPALRVSIGENPAQILLIAEVHSANGEQILMSSVPRADLSVAQKTFAAPRLQKELIWHQAEPILDAIENTTEDGKPRLFLLLSRDALTLFRSENDRWVQRDSKPLPTAAATTRDPRGKIWFSTDTPEQARIVLPGKECEAKLKDRIELTCRAAKETWQEGMFLASTCDGSAWWLRSDSGDRSAPDRLLLRNPQQGEKDPSVAVLGVPGPVLSISSGQAIRADTAVVFNLSTGNYDVYRITLACGN